MRQPPALTRAFAAFAIIDEYCALPPQRQGGIRERNYHAALARLGDAMNDLYGPLPAIRVRGWDDDRDDQIGDELADREGRT